LRISIDDLTVLLA